MDNEFVRSTTTTNANEEQIVGVVTLLAAIAAAFLMVMHGMRTFQDLCTEQRKSVSAQPVCEKTVAYTIGVYLKHFAIVCYGVALIAGAVTSNFWPREYGDCFSLNVVIVSAWQIALTFHHFAYITYLYQCYPRVPGSDRHFGFKVEHLACCVVLVLFFGFFWTVYLVATSAQNGILEQDSDGAWPFHCDISLDPNPLVLGVLMLAWQFCLSAGSFYSFYRAFAEFAEWLKQGGYDKKVEDAKDCDYDMKQVLYTGYKFKVIVGTQAVSSFVWILLALLNMRVLYKVGANIAWLISMVSLMLLTPYYRGAFWFKVLCFPCIFCDSNRGNYVGKDAIEGAAVDVHYLFSAYAQEVEQKRSAKNGVELQQTGQTDVVDAYASQKEN